MLPKIIYRQAYKDITTAYHSGTYNTQEWISRVKSIYADFKMYYPNEELFDD